MPPAEIRPEIHARQTIPLDSTLSIDVFVLNPSRQKVSSKKIRNPGVARSLQAEAAP
jgi:hypothetical protein